MYTLPICPGHDGLWLQLLGVADVHHSDLQHDFILTLSQSILSQIFTCLGVTKDGKGIFGWGSGFALISRTQL